jgi:hypothetical protein
MIVSHEVAHQAVEDVNVESDFGHALYSNGCYCGQFSRFARFG